MEKSQSKYVIISDFNIRSNNRGTAALGYGAIGFLLKNNYIDDSYQIINYSFYRNPFRKHKPSVQELEIGGRKWIYQIIPVWFVERWLSKLRLHFIPSLYNRTIRKVKLVAAINGGDGLTDIYGEELLNARLPEMELAIENNIPFIVLPQTIGPFHDKNKKKRIIDILKRAEKIYVRDTAFVLELNNNQLNYEKANDLSYYMLPQPFEIDIKHKCVGVNVSGLAYSNKFGNLVGQFDNYPKLMTEIVRMFQKKGCYVYIIPHSYNVEKPELNNDDMQASIEFYEKLEDKKNVIFVRDNLISPQIKYLISQMDFFIGTRMHANFAAIFTNTPVFGLAYSYKFEGAFAENGLKDSTYMITNLKEEEIPSLIDRINKKFKLA